MSRLMLYILFFVICLGLGYPTLNRYDPRRAGNIDSVQYYGLVMGSPQDVEGRGRYRVLVPYLSKPLYLVVKGHVGTWDPVFLSLLVTNSAFTAASAYLLVHLGWKALSNPAIALLGGTLYLLNFTVPNGHLAGLVDASEGFLILAVAVTLLADRWWPLPILGIVGALAKETFVVLATAFAASWWLTTAHSDRSRFRRLAWVAAMGLAGLATVSGVQSLVSGVMVWPWMVMGAARSDVGYFTGLLGCLTERSFWYVLGWLLLLGLWQLRRLPQPWVLASVGAALAALHLGAYHNAGGNVARAMFNASGPVLSLSLALALTRLSLDPPVSKEVTRE
jgi:hypothetical protein